MADAAVQITEGTGGIFVDTRTEAGSSQHRQVVVLGDPSSNAGVAPVDATTGLAVNVTNASLATTVTTLPALPAGGNTIGNVGLAPSTNMLGHVGGTDYKGVAANATNAPLGTTGGGTGGLGEYLAGLLIVPGTTAAGAVSVKDGTLTAFTIFAGGGTTALNSLIPFFVPIGAKSVQGGWQVTTGANVTVVGVGDFI